MTDCKMIVLTPVFEDTEASNILFSELAKIYGDNICVIAVDDGSVKHPLTLRGLDNAGVRGSVIRLRRNVGHQRAIAIGLAYIADYFETIDRVVVMDSDGEDLPETIGELVSILDQEEVDVVVAQRKSRVESLKFKLFYAIYKFLFKQLTGRRISFGNFMAMNARGVRRLASMGELATHVAGTVLVSRLRWRSCAIDRGPRYAGKSKMNFVGLALHGFRALMIFAEDVLVRVGIACALVAALAILGVSAAVALKAFGYATPGWFSVVLGLLLLMFLQTGAITLMTLMLTGVVKGRSVLAMDYKLVIEEVLTTHQPADDN